MRHFDGVKINNSNYIFRYYITCITNIVRIIFPVIFVKAVDNQKQWDKMAEIPSEIDTFSKQRS